MSQLLLVTARPGIQLLWTVLVVSVLVYSIASQGAAHLWAIVLMCTSYAVVITGNHMMPFKKYRPFSFFLLMLASLALISSIVYLTGNRDSQLGFLYSLIPIVAAAYYSYTGTLVVAAVTALTRYIPYVTVNVGSLTQLAPASPLSPFS